VTGGRETRLDAARAHVKCAGLQTERLSARRVSISSAARVEIVEIDSDT
jgi:hypothetical protein